MKNSKEIKIGFMFAVAVILLGWLTIKTGNFNLSNDGYSLIVHFKNIDGVNLNSPVMINGFEVGIVDDIQIKDENEDTFVELTLWINNKAKPRGGAKAFVKNLGFMGEKYIGLTSGNKKEPHLKPGSLIIGEEPPKFEKLIAEGKEIAVQIKQITKNINERLDNNGQTIDEILNNLNDTTRNIASISDNVDQRLKVNQNNFDEIITHLNSTTLNLEELTYDLKHNPWKIIHKPKDKKKKRKSEESKSQDES